MTDRQRRKMWAMMTDIANTQPWAGWVTKDEWKTFFADSTRDFTVEEMSELLTRIRDYGDNNGVKFSDEEGLTWQRNHRKESRQTRANSSASAK